MKRSDKDAMMKQTKKINWGEPRYNEQNEGIMVCDGVCAYVCCRCVYVCACVSVHVSPQDSTRAHTHVCMQSLLLRYFYNFSDFLDF